MRASSVQSNQKFCKSRALSRLLVLQECISLPSLTAMCGARELIYFREGASQSVTLGLSLSRRPMNKLLSPRGSSI